MEIIFQPDADEYHHKYRCEKRNSQLADKTEVIPNIISAFHQSALRICIYACKGQTTALCN